MNTTNLIYQVSPASVRKFSCGNKTGLTRKIFQQRFWKLLKKPSFKHSPNNRATSASVKRVNSALRRAKTDFRSTMGEERLNALLLVHIHRDIFLEYDKIIDIYASKYPRRMLLINLLSEN